MKCLTSDTDALLVWKTPTNPWVVSVVDFWRLLQNWTSKEQWWLVKLLLVNIVLEVDWVSIVLCSMRGKRAEVLQSPCLLDWHQRKYGVRSISTGVWVCWLEYLFEFGCWLSYFLFTPLFNWSPCVHLYGADGRMIRQLPLHDQTIKLCLSVQCHISLYLKTVESHQVSK